MTWNAYGLRLIDFVWLVLSVSFFAALWGHKIAKRLPSKYQTCCLNVLFQDLVRYGKTKQNFKRNDWLRAFDVPKRWFWHFYATSLVWNGLLLAFIPVDVQIAREVCFGSSCMLLLAHIDPHVSTVLLQLLLLSHSLRRLAECLCVSVFSDGVIHLLQYVFGLAYYLLLGFTALCSDPSGPLLSQLEWCHVAGIALFIPASLLQHQSMVLLAGLRIGKSGRVETLTHRMPKGGCFELVSCPHYLAELLIYVSLSLVAGSLSLTWWLVVLYVLFNQALAALLCHEHYIDKYPSYPARRKAFIPFVM
uniref:Polyprenal reductase n=1 Tax=Hippocampus comes TaxID=109280 RepID=A0A3Q2Z1W3_HIPCM